MNKPKIKYSKGLKHNLKRSQGPTRIQRYHSRLAAKIKQFKDSCHDYRKRHLARRANRRLATEKIQLAHKRAKLNERRRTNSSKSSGKQKHHLNYTGAAVLCVILLMAVGSGTYYVVHSHNAQARQDRIAREQRAKEVAVTLKATPKSPIFEGNNQVGMTTSSGTCRLQNVMVGSKLYTEYGKMKSNPIIVTKADEKAPVMFTFNYLKGNQAQQYLTKYYQCISNLVNHNDQNYKNLSLGSFFMNGSASSAYKNEFKWGKMQYESIQKHKKSKSDKGDTSKDRQVPFTALHFTIAMQNAILNEDGTVTLNYAVRDDFAGQTHDHVDVYNMNAVVKLIHGHWQIVTIHKPVTPKVSYND